MLLEKVLEAPDLMLRSLNPRDATETYLRWLHDPEVVAFLEIRFRPPQSVDQLRAYIEACRSDPETLLAGIFKKNGREHIGNIKLGPIYHRHRSAELGFLIGEKKEWGRGWAGQAIRVLCNHAFQNLQLEKITAGCYEQNLASQRVLLKAGFRQEGVRVSQWEVQGKRQNGLIFGLLRAGEGIS